MGDRNHRPPTHQPIKLSLYGGLDFRIKRGCRLIQHEYRRILEDDPGDRNSLPLPAGQLYATFANKCLISRMTLPILQPYDEVIGFCPPCRRNRLIPAGRNGCSH